MLAGAGAYGQVEGLQALASNINIEGLETSYDPATGIAPTRRAAADGRRGGARATGGL
jgi:hypothetical protein